MGPPTTTGSSWLRRSRRSCPGYETPLYTYNGTFPGPTIKVERNRRVRMRQVNDLPAYDDRLRYVPTTSVHLHGSPSKPQFDGYASDITSPGQYKDYWFNNEEHARTLWYHDHGVHHTAENVYQGLAGQYHLVDAAEDALQLPTGDYDVALTVSDAMFNADGSLLFNRTEDSGVWGDVILVNGVPWPLMQVERRKYRFRILNAAISRSYNLSLSTGDPFTVIATDGGLMPRPQSVRSMRHSSAERYEIVIDFSKYSAGQRVVLRNSSPKNNVNYANVNKVMAFEVVGPRIDPGPPIPAVLTTDNVTMNLTLGQHVKERKMTVRRANGQWTINGTTWEKVVESGFTHVEGKPVMNTVELWTLSNPSGGWFHPFHIHLVDFQIVDRNGRPPFAYERGPKDVVYLGENEHIRVLIKFDNGFGKYMMHCHNLPHEDHDMMTQFEVVHPGGTAAPSPLSAPALDQPEIPFGP